MYEELLVTQYMLAVSWSEKLQLQDQLKFEQEHTAVELERLERERKIYDLKIQNLRSEWEIEHLRIERDFHLISLQRLPTSVKMHIMPTRWGLL